MAAGDRPAADPEGPGARTLDALRIDALTWLAPSISHELANPLAALVAFSGLLAADPRLPADLQADVRMLRDEAERTNQLVRTVIELLRDRPQVAAPVDVAVLLDEVLALAAPRMTDIEVVRVVGEPSPVAETDPSRARRVLLVLVVEALRAFGAQPRGGRLRIEVRRAGADRVEIAVDYRPATDVGVEPSLPAGDTPIADLGATVRVSRDASGGRLELALPSAVADDTRRSGTAAPPPERGQLTVLVCDDEDAIRALLVRVLERDGVGAIAAANAAEALDALRSSTVDVVITDHRMAGMSGIELYDSAVESRHELRDRFVVMSGEPGSDELRAFVERTGVLVIPKPFDVPAIPALVREIARAGATAAQRG